MPRGICLWSVVSCTVSMAAGLTSMAQRGLGGRRLMMDARRVVALSGTVATSMVGLAS
jgi:hypothetical protein